MRLFRRRASDEDSATTSLVASEKRDREKPDRVKADTIYQNAKPDPLIPTLPIARTPSTPGLSTPAMPCVVPVVPPTPLSVPIPTPVLSVDAAMDELVASLSDALITQAGDEYEASWSLDDPSARVEELLADSRAEFGDAIVDQVETDAWSAMFDAAQELSDRLRDDTDDADDSGL